MTRLHALATHAERIPMRNRLRLLHCDAADRGCSEQSSLGYSPEGVLRPPSFDPALSGKTLVPKAHFAFALWYPSATSMLSHR